MIPSGVMRVFIVFNLLLLFSEANNGVLTISQAYKMAMTNSNQVKSIDKQLNMSDERINQAKARLYPQVSLETSASKENRDIFSDLTNDYQYRTHKKILDNQLVVKQMVYDKEVTTKIDVEESRKDLDVAKAELEKQGIAKSILKIYIDILKSKNKIELYETYLRYTELKLLATQKQYDVRLSNKMDLLEAQVNYNNSKIDLKKEKDLLKLNNLKLQNIIGEGRYELPKINFSKKVNEKDLMVLKSSIDTNVENNLKIKQATLATNVYKNEIDNASSEHLPKVYLEGYYSTYYDQQKVMAVMNMPLYQGGMTTAKVNESKLGYFASMDELEQAKKDAKAEYDEYVLNLSSHLESLKLYNESLEFSGMYVKYIEQAFNKGLKSIIDLYEANNKLFEVKSKYIDTLYEVLNNYVEIIVLSNNVDGLKNIDNILKD